MAVSTVIEAAPETVTVAYAVSFLSLDTFQKILKVTLATVDANGDQIKGGATIDHTITGAKFDAFVAPMTQGILQAVVALYIADGKLKPGASVKDVAK